MRGTFCQISMVGFGVTYGQPEGVKICFFVSSYIHKFTIMTLLISTKKSPGGYINACSLLGRNWSGWWLIRLRSSDNFLLGSLLLLLLLLGSICWSCCVGLCWGSLHLLLLLLFLLLIHTSSNKQVNHRLCKDSAIVVKIKLFKHIVNLFLSQFVTKIHQEVFEVLSVDQILHSGYVLHSLGKLFVVAFEGSHNEVVRIVNKSGHFCLETLDHVFVVARSPNLTQHRVQLLLRHERPNVVKSCSEIIFVYDTVLVDIHEFEALPIQFKLVIGESTRPFAGPLALALTHDAASPCTRQTLILTTADTFEAIKLRVPM